MILRCLQQWRTSIAMCYHWIVIFIQSHSNPRFKQIKGLLKSRTRKQGDTFLMEGRPELDHALKLGWKPLQVLYCEAYIDLESIESLLDTSRVEVLHLAKALFDDLAYQSVPENFMVVFEKRTIEMSALDPKKPCVLLEGIEKPGNLGAILRTCDALGVDQLIVCESDIDLFNPNVLRNSRGAAFSVKTVFASNEEALTFAQSGGKKILAAALTEEAVDFKKIPVTNGSVYCFGAESKGLSSFWLKHADHHLVIPMRGVVDSLNVSISVAMMLAHFTNA